MAIQSIPAAAAGKTSFKQTLTSGVSYTVPAGVTYLNVTLQGGGGGGGGAAGPTLSQTGLPGQAISSTFAATAGSSISYAIGAGGTAGSGGPGGQGGTTTMTGATSAIGGGGGVNSTGAGGGTGATGTNAGYLNSGAGSGGATSGGVGGAGRIDIEYWA